MQLCLNYATATLEQCIAAAHQEEQLAETESLQCPLTLLFDTTFRTTTIETLPLKLVIQLKRFSVSGKNNKAVKIPRILKIHSATQGYVHYNLTAAIIHHGSLHQGHYTAITFSQHPESIVYCDDAATRAISWATAENLLQQGYVLAYSRRTQN